MCGCENRRDVRGDEELLVTEADDNQWTVADCNNLLQVFDWREHDGKHAAHQFQGSADRLLQPVVAHLALDEE